MYELHTVVFAIDVKLLELMLCKIMWYVCTYACNKRKRLHHRHHTDCTHIQQTLTIETTHGTT